MSLNPSIAPKTTIGMILKGYPRISETFIANEILLLERLGFDVHIFSMRQPREAFAHATVREIKAKVDYLPENLLAPLPIFLWYNIQLLLRRPRAYLAALGLTLKRWCRSRKSATFKHLLQAGYLVQRCLPRTRVGHLHAHFAHSPTSVALFSSVLSGLPFSFTAHAKDIYTSNPAQLREKIEKAAFVVTCTEYNRRHLLRLTGSAAKSVHRVYHGIDLRFFNSELDKASPKPPYRLLTVARMTEKKGLDDVYRALAILKARGIPFTHTLIGEGDDRDELLALIERLDLDDVTRWLGTQPHGVVLDEYRNADATVLGCRIAANGDRDGIPNVIVESMAVGVPVVATRVSAIPEIVRHGQTGLLVSPKKPAELADAILRVLDDTELRARIIPAAKVAVNRDFDNRRLIRDLAAIYSRYMGT
ncbi:glycosyltransferase family 4 protein [Desulfosarcina ovata]|uniref:Colanic acid biosynthesis glycosyltransferase WcaL n=1 Tax=Desulfosarcina ovata subsp. ovata TaxID=2752305 RepID=A0A5K8AL32_9BACT|nr:glycosyltransferase family 4 protein [Desulfosarcina ovata]BBO93447.1 colanic acid biosynthesis glycosyltransferase WcaL [Desulfosarcina ovata subsp. ovata]